MMAAPDGPVESSAEDADGDTGSGGSILRRPEIPRHEPRATRQLRALFAAPPQPPARAATAARHDRCQPRESTAFPTQSMKGTRSTSCSSGSADVYATDGMNSRSSRLIGPNAATRTAVLALLMEKSFDILHFAGHQVFATRNRRPVSGWLFSDDTYLTASEQIGSTGFLSSSFRTPANRPHCPSRVSRTHRWPHSRRRSLSRGRELRVHGLAHS
jgi:hypothetical protein